MARIIAKIIAQIRVIIKSVSIHERGEKQDLK